MSERDVYEVLQVHPAAHQLVIQAAYRVLASMYHPDRDPSGAATRKMAELNAAYGKARLSPSRLGPRARRTERPGDPPRMPAWSTSAATTGGPSISWLARIRTTCAG